MLHYQVTTRRLKIALLLFIVAVLLVGISLDVFLDEESGLYLTRARLGNVTFWVKFTETETGYLVHRAYSHRMTIHNR